MEAINKDNRKIALKFSLDDIGEGLNFFTQDKDFIQVGGWKYKKGKKLPVHAHNVFSREAMRTQEFIFVVRGSLKALLYDDKNELIKEVNVSANEGLILFNGGHGYEILENDTVVVETKNGPYHGPEADRKRLKDEE